MKKASILLSLIAILSIASLTVKAQVFATASSSATIITPIAISKSVDMNFGNVAVSSTAGTVVLASTGTRTKTGGVTLPLIAGTVSAAKFTVTGLAATTYSISFDNPSIVLTSGGNTMTVNAFTSNPTPTGTLSAGGTQDILVGATLNVTGSQPAGLYTNATDLKVTVNYN